MRGRPLWQWAFFCAFWLALLWPMARVTGRPGSPHEPSTALAAADAPSRAVWLTWTFSDSPDSVQLIWEGEVCWELAQVDGVRLEQARELSWPQEGPELMVQATWSGACHRAMELLVEPVDGAPRSITRWTDGESLRERIVLAP